MDELSGVVEPATVWPGTVWFPPTFGIVWLGAALDDGPKALWFGAVGSDDVNGADPLWLVPVALREDDAGGKPAWLGTVWLDPGVEVAPANPDCVWFFGAAVAAGRPVWFKDAVGGKPDWFGLGRDEFALSPVCLAVGAVVVLVAAAWLGNVDGPVVFRSEDGAGLV